LLALLGAGPVLALVVTLVGLDAVSFGWHRANHRIPLLWRFHRVHHADENFHVSTALRFHPGELLLALPVRLAAIVALGASPLGVLVFEILFGVANLLEHGNFDLPGRIERRVQHWLITPTQHRAHHARDWTDLGTHFGTIFSVWDRASGTFRPRDTSARFETGVPDDAHGAHATLGATLSYPFVEAARDRPGPR
jgi:sterol desaturase/sphingolipid hydroxylase (fatty acid hydroxylase superfamily)